MTAINALASPLRALLRPHRSPGRLLKTILALGALSAAGAAAAQTATPAPAPALGGIHGVLYFTNGKPVIDYGVTLETTGARTPSTTHGYFEFTKVPEGEHTIVVNGPEGRVLTITRAIVRPGAVLDLGDLTVGTPSAPATTAADSRYLLVMEKTVVLGRKAEVYETKSTDITRSENDPMPFQTFDARDIALSGAADLNEFLTRRITANTPTANVDVGNANNNLLPISNLNLGNLNARASTLSTTSRTGTASAVVILVNGMPAPAILAANQGGYGQPDIRGIPLNLIERIEVLPVASGTIYGANAAGGAINIITKSGYVGGGVTARFETHTGGSDLRQSYSGNYNVALPSGLNIQVVVTRQNDKPLLFGDVADETILRHRRRIAANTDAANINYYGAFSPPVLGATGNFRPSSSTATVGLFGTGTARFAQVKPGATFVSGATGFTTGSYNLDIPSGLVVNGRLMGLGYDHINRHTIGLELTKRFDRDWSASVGFSGYDMDYDRAGDLGAAFRNTVTLNAAAAINFSPFSTAVWGSWADPRLATLPGLGSNGRVINNTVNAKVVGKLWADWRLLASFAYTDTRTDYDVRTFSQPYIPATGTFAGTNFATAVNGNATLGISAVYNPFVDGNVTAFAPDSFYSRYYQSRLVGAASGGQANARLRLAGAGFTLPAGEQLVVVGGDIDRNTRRSASTTRTIDTGTGTVISTVDSSVSFTNNTRFADRTNTGGYAEVLTPILGDAQKIPFVNRLDLQLSGRVDRYTTGVAKSVASQVGQIGLSYAVIPDVTFRASVSNGFQPPTADELTPNTIPNTSTQTVVDPLTNASVVLATNQYVTGGNPDLEATRSKSRQVGVVVQPRGLRGLRLSADFSQTALRNVITSYNLQTIVSAIPGLVTRNASNAITFVDGRYMNSALAETERIDYRISYERGTPLGGYVYATVSASQFLSYRSQVTPLFPIIQNIGNAHSSWQRDEWPGGTLAVNWSRGPWSYGWTARYYGSRLLPLSTSTTVQNPANSASDIALLAVQGNNKIGSAIFHDLVVSYRNPARLGTTGWRRHLENTIVTVGAKNAFDHSLRFNAANLTYGILDDLSEGRSVFLSLTKSF